LLSSLQIYALQFPCSEGRHGKEILKPHFLKERWVFLFYSRKNLCGKKDETNDQNKKYEERRGNCSIGHRNYFDYFSFPYLWVLWVGSWINWCADYPYGHIWILTLKRIYAEGLQQRRRKEIDL
jgi:hypothetical protein